MTPGGPMDQSDFKIEAYGIVTPPDPPEETDEETDEESED